MVRSAAAGLRIHPWRLDAEDQGRRTRQCAPLQRAHQAAGLNGRGLNKKATLAGGFFVAPRRLLLWPDGRLIPLSVGLIYTRLYMIVVASSLPASCGSRLKCGICPTVT
ncbi:hypothetical protein G6F68_016113 [Rhizopus microsporus]|nr:hypothetical protein G6F68_016113 [Rhizopus microsporus]